MKKIDRYGNRLHMLLLHDPLISGKFHQERQVPDAKAKKDFEKKLSVEESKFASIAMEKLEEELKQIYEENKRLEDEKAARYFFRFIISFIKYITFITTTTTTIV